MKNTIFAVMVLAMLVMPGCNLQANNNAANSASAAKASAEDAGGKAAELVQLCNGQADRLMLIMQPILGYEANIASKLLLRNALDRISEFSQKAKEMEKTLGEIEKAGLSGKEDYAPYISKNRELLNTAKLIVEKYSELYNYELDMMEQKESGQKNNKMEDLHNAIVNCRCDEVDCNAYMSSSLNFIDDSIAVFRRIESKYGLKIFGTAAEEWSQDREIVQKHWPGLIKKSESYGDRCYRINDAYSQYLNDLDSVKRQTESEIADAVSSKWLLSIMNLAAQIDQLKADVDDARKGVEA